MKVLVACEESQAVTIELRKLGIEAYSCDIIECSGGHPEWHIQGDVRGILNPLLYSGWGKNAKVGIEFETSDGKKHFVNGKWDAIVAFPPCTFLTNTGNRWFNIEKYGEKAVQRLKDREKAAEFFMDIWNANCEIVIMENPIGYISSYFRKPDQIVQPYYFAEFQDDENCERKATCFWMRGADPLQYEIKFSPRIIYYKNGKGTDSPWHMNTMGLPKEERAKMRSKTYPGIAKAIAKQISAKQLLEPLV